MPCSDVLRELKEIQLPIDRHCSLFNNTNTKVTVAIFLVFITVFNALRNRDSFRRDLMIAGCALPSTNTSLSAATLIQNQNSKQGREESPVMQRSRDSSENRDITTLLELGGSVRFYQTFSQSKHKVRIEEEPEWCLLFHIYRKGSVAIVVLAAT